MDFPFFFFASALFSGTSLAAIGAALAAVGATFASFFSDETTAERCKTIGGQDVSNNTKIHRNIYCRRGGQNSQKSSHWTSGYRHVDEGGRGKDCRPTMLPNIRGLSFASRRPAEAGPADIASNPFLSCQPLFAPKLGMLSPLPIAIFCSSTSAGSRTLGAKALGETSEIKEH